MTRILLLLAGYVCGLIQSGYLYGKLHGTDIRTRGSGNVGATNTLRVFGKRAGAIILACDLLKAFIPCFIVGLVYKDSPDLRYIYIMWTGLGVVLGHNFPLYLGFRGGKGVASAAGMLLALDWKLLVLLAVVFALTVLISRIVSLASIIVLILFVIFTVIFSRTGIYPISADAATEFNILCAIVGGMGVIRHSANIKRLAEGKENRIDLSR